MVDAPAISRTEAPAALAKDIVLEAQNLSTHFVYKTRTAKAVRDVSFTLQKGRTLAIVGESGSGKSVTSLSAMRLLGPTGEIAGGSILYRKRDGTVVDLARQSQAAMRQIRGREISMIFQEPMTSLNPLFTIGDQIGEMLLLHERLAAPDIRRRVIEMLNLVEIPGAERRLDDYPHQMSGGMRQRVMIAMALICRPALLIADEPTTALDVTIQAQILDLIRRLQRELAMSVLFITHDMGVVAEVADEVAVMYAGEVVEQAPVRDIFAHPRHPYTLGLLASIPNVRRDFDAAGARRRLVPIPGTVPSLYAMPPGCAFAPRCPYAVPPCGSPVHLERIAPKHLSRCIRAGEL
ncbi:ABC transporter ATP-binding protein [Chelativorans xinjiangense]|uniref:ABC transporter ATP-binding protein n=1 Tax=Chelativorans xinjiangense TaxID=2681485 RepID=UPI0013571BA4|nr:ABC transporter ATP-binding protein [Chelativorans xinjiangense]